MSLAVGTKALRNGSGFSSSNHQELNKWLESITEEEVFTKLGEYRGQFAHRLDHFKDIKEENKLLPPEALTKILDTVEEAVKRLIEL